MKFFGKILCGILTAAIIGCMFVLPDITLSFTDTQNTMPEQRAISPIALELSTNLPFLEKIRLASLDELTTRTPIRQTTSDAELVYQAASEFYCKLAASINWEQVDFLNCPRQDNSYRYLDTNSGKNAIFWDIQVAVEDSVYLQFIIDDQNLDVLSIGLLITDITDMQTATEKIASFGNALMDRLSTQVDGEWNCINIDRKEIDGVTVPVAARYELNIESDGHFYSFYLEYNNNELHFGNTSFGMMPF